MNRNELAAVLAATHHQQQQNRSVRTDQQHSSLSPLSRRQVFQSRVRELGGQSNNNNSSIVETSDQSNSKFSSLDGLVSPTKTTHQPPKRLYRGAAGRTLRKRPANKEPDFVLEERAAWEDTRDIKRPQHNEDDFILIPPSNESSESSDDLTLVPFAPTSNVQTQRPKTSRGRPQPSHVDDDEPVEKTPIRPSKFSEGSMNARSVGISSTWSEHGERLSLDLTSEDSDATPRATRPSTDSLNSSDLSDFRPEGTTPATIKQRLTKFASSLKPVVGSEKADTNERKTPKRKGLRKSISIWGMQKFFGASASDATPEESANQTQLDALTERKRKAEEAYEQQFGFKKQKANNGQSVDDPNRTIRGPQRTLQKRSISANRTITPGTKRRREVGSRAAAAAAAASSDMSEEDGDTDRRKRPSRRELEKENHQLRALLREQQAQSRANLSLVASRSSLHLPLEVDDEPVTNSKAPPARKTPRTHKLPKVPPVPPLPERAVLANMSNNNLKAHLPPAATGTMKRIKGGAPQMRGQGEGTENKVPQGPTKEWTWPDDVF